MEHREYQLERKESQVRAFENDLHRREKQLTDLILKNERGDRSLESRFFNGEDTALLSNLMNGPSTSDGIDLNKSGGS